MAESTPIEAPAPWRSSVGQGIGRVLFTTLWTTRTIDADLVPGAGPVILVANHTGFLDGPVAFTVAPRRSNFIVKQELFHGPLGTLLRFVGQIPIDRSTGDRRALGTARAVLQAGGMVGMFPEGTRGRGDVAEINSGAAWLALATGATVVPVAGLGMRRSGTEVGRLPRLRSRLTIVFGQPFGLDSVPAGPGRVRLAAATELIRERLAAHVIEASERTGIALPD